MEICQIFLKKNFSAIKAMIGNANASLMDAVIVSCAGGFCSDEKADEIEAFFKANPLPSNGRKIAQCIEGMRTNSKFFDKLKASELSSGSFWKSL